MMKFAILSLIMGIIGVICPSTASAQIVTLRGGVNFATTDGSYDYRYLVMQDGFRVGGNGGVFFDVPINSVFSFETGINGMTRGFYKKREFLSSAIGEFEEQLIYIDIPLVMKAGVPLSSDLRLVGGYGFYVGIGVDGWERVRIHATSGWPRSEKTVTDVSWAMIPNREYERHRFEIGHVFSLSIETQRFTAGLLYTTAATGRRGINAGGYNAVISTFWGYRWAL